MKKSYNRIGYILKKTLVVLLIFMLITPSQCTRHLQQIPGMGNKQRFLKDSYNYFVTKDQNTVWAGALSLAWNQLTDSIIKQDIKLNSDDKVVSKVVSNFNESPFTKKALTEADYYIKSGYGQKTVTTINKEVKKKFPNRSFPDIDVSLNDKDIISYAYLAKSFQYPTKFTVVKDFTFKNSSVRGFRAANNQQRDQVKYLYYKNRNEFMIKLETKNENEGVYMLRTDYKAAKVKDIIDQVNKWEKQLLMSLSDIDYFSMPVIDFDYNREITQVQNINLQNEKFTDYVFAKVYEGLKLNIDQTGVKVENQGVIIAKLTSAYVQQREQPKYFVLDDTFWIVLKEKKNQPYLCIKVNSPSEKQSL